MSDAKMAEIKARRSKITKLPWWRTDPPFGHSTTVHAGPSDDPHLATCYIADGHIPSDGLTASEITENMDFIAHAPTDVDCLLGIVAGLRNELEANEIYWPDGTPVRKSESGKIIPPHDTGEYSDTDYASLADLQADWERLYQAEIELRDQSASLKEI